MHALAVSRQQPLDVVREQLFDGAQLRAPVVPADIRMRSERARIAVPREMIAAEQIRAVLQHAVSARARSCVPRRLRGRRRRGCTPRPHFEPVQPCMLPDNLRGHHRIEVANRTVDTAGRRPARVVHFALLANDGSQVRRREAISNETPRGPLQAKAALEGVNALDERVIGHVLAVVTDRHPTDALIAAQRDHVDSPRNRTARPLASKLIAALSM